jgi:hypothetical protein
VSPREHIGEPNTQRELPGDPRDACGLPSDVELDLGLVLLANDGDLRAVEVLTERLRVPLLRGALACAAAGVPRAVCDYTLALALTRALATFGQGSVGSFRAHACYWLRRTMYELLAQDTDSSPLN